MNSPSMLFQKKDFSKNLLVGLLMVWSTGLSTRLGAATVEERLEALELQVAQLQAENEALRREISRTPGSKPTEPVFPSPPPPVLEVKSAGKQSRLVIGGFIQALGETGESPDPRYNGVRDRFLLRRARINMTAKLAEHFTGRVEVDFGANSIHTSSGIRGQMTDGYVRWDRYPLAKITMGQFKTPFGFEQLASDTTLLTIERALSNDRLTVSRQIGVGLSGEMLEKRLSYSIGVFNGSGVNTGINDNDAMMYAGRLNGQIFKGRVSGQPLSWNAGLNAFSSKDKGTMVETRTGFGIDTQIRLGSFSLLTEYLLNRRDPESGSSLDSEGYSLLLGYELDTQWRTAIRYDFFNSNVDSDNMTSDLWTFAVDYRIRGDDLKLSINYLLGEQPEASGYQGRWSGRIQLIF